ncbi:hypothetical protein L6R29_25660, partial [Myxococcota bacterium]|nr:hypothetical protein [Myxococcota bacterium]
MPNPVSLGHRAFSWLAALALFWAVMAVSCVLRPWPDFLCHPCVDDCLDRGLICREKVCVPQSNPDPKQCASEQTDGGSEKTEPLPENLPEEALFPEDAAPSDGEALHEQDPEIVIQETEQPYIERVNGNGTLRPVNAAASPSKI